MQSAIVEYYRHEYVEAGRLRRSAAGRLEYLRTRELLRRKLPSEGARVVDVGGGTGAHAAWLNHDGYQVELFDLVPEHVEQAQAALPNVTSTVADARDLPLPDGYADAVLLLGPLYHLESAEDRSTALCEASRVARRGAVIAAAGISRHAALLNLAVRGRLSDPTVDLVRNEMRTGKHDPRLGFTSAHTHTPAELANELCRAGLADVAVYGVEGPLWPATRLLPSVADLTHYLIVARELERDPAALALSAHLLAFGTKC